jgi:hypothetical protein
LFSSTELFERPMSVGARLSFVTVMSRVTTLLAWLVGSPSSARKLIVRLPDGVSGAVS